MSAALVTTCVATLTVGAAATNAAPTPRARFSDTRVVAGTPVTVVAEPGTRPEGTRFRLQQKYADGWHTVDRHPDHTDRGVVFSVPTDQYGRFRFRVAAQDRSGDVVAASLTQRVSIRPRYDPKGPRTAYRFSAHPRIRWDSCRPIRWAFFPRNSPEHAKRQLKKAFDRVRTATGLDFDYVGRTNHPPVAAGRDLHGVDVVVGWRTAAHFRGFRHDRDVVGVGGNSFLTGYEAADGTRVGRIFRGGVVLNADQERRLKNGFGPGFTWGEVIEHELGHVVGLGHPRNSRQIMYSTLTHRNAAWGAGDLKGLRLVGDRSGCLEPTAGPRTAVGRSVVPGDQETLRTAPN